MKDERIRSADDNIRTEVMLVASAFSLTEKELAQLVSDFARDLTEDIKD